MNDYRREDYVTPRSFKEATGEFYSYEEADPVEEWLWMVVVCLGYVVCFLIMVGVI